MIAAETRAILGLNHDFMLKQMVGTKLDVAAFLAPRPKEPASPLPPGPPLAGRARRPRKPPRGRLIWPQPPTGSSFGVDSHRPERQA